MCETKEKTHSPMRFLIFPLLLAAVYVVQLYVPNVLGSFALRENHLRWWQFFTNAFLSANLVHLFCNCGALWVLAAEFAPRTRTEWLLLGFILFSAASSFLYFQFIMSPNEALVGASSGIYSLVGVFSWSHRHTRFTIVGLRRIGVSIYLLLALLLSVEFAVAQRWLPALAWSLHLIAFALGLSTALFVSACKNVWRLCRI